MITALSGLMVNPPRAQRAGAVTHPLDVPPPSALCFLNSPGERLIPGASVVSDGSGTVLQVQEEMLLSRDSWSPSFFFTSVYSIEAACLGHGTYETKAPC